MIRISVYEPGQEVYLVFTSIKEGHKKNLVFKSVIEHISITKETKEPVYCTKILKCVNDKTQNISSFTSYMLFKNANVDTGYRGFGQCYPVFTTKEKCIEWLRS